MQSIATNVSSAAIDIVQRDGSVSMHVHDAPLGEVLSAVQRLTRASVEATDVADEERVTVDVGPMPVLEVMETMQFMAKHIGAVVATATRAANSTDAAGIQSDFEPRLCYAYGMFTAIADSRAMNVFA